MNTSVTAQRIKKVLDEIPLKLTIGGKVEATLSGNYGITAADFVEHGVVHRNNLRQINLPKELENLFFIELKNAGKLDVGDRDVTDLPLTRVVTTTHIKVEQDIEVTHLRKQVNGLLEKIDSLSNIIHEKELEISKEKQTNLTLQSVLSTIREENRNKDAILLELQSVKELNEKMIYSGRASEKQEPYKGYFIGLTGGFASKLKRYLDYKEVPCSINPTYADIWIWVGDLDPVEIVELKENDNYKDMILCVAQEKVPFTYESLFERKVDCRFVNGAAMNYNDFNSVVAVIERRIGGIS